MNKTKTLLEYLTNLSINEAKADVEYEKNYSSIPRDVFDIIVGMDPKTQKSGDTIVNIGFGAKQLLLPKYMDGETAFIETPDVVTAALTSYYPNISTYPKFHEFRSVADFLAFMANPDSAEIEKAVAESPLDKLYNKYYNTIDRDIFNTIITMDPKTAEDKIGEVAKNLLLAKYLKGETDFIDSADAVTAAIQRFYAKGQNYPDGKDNIQNYESVEEFINYTPTSPTIAAVPHLTPGVDYELVASSSTHDMFKLLTWQGSRDLAHARGGTNVWCTAGGDSGQRYLDSDGISSYWKNYQPNGSRQTQLYEILSKNEPRDRTANYNLALKIGSGEVYEFRDGNNHCPNGGHAEFLQSVLLQDPELTAELVKCSDPLLRSCPTIRNVFELIRYALEPLIIDGQRDFAKVLRNYEALKSCAKEITIRNVEEIPFSMFSDFVVLTTLNLGEGLKVIGGQAFKSCTGLTKLVLPESLEVIGKEAFAGCVKLKGAVKLPNNVKRIERNAFFGTHCKLKIDKDRTTKLKMDKADMDWIKSHVQSIKV